MHFPTTLALSLATALPALAAPAPAPANAKSMMASTAEWTITSFTRTCNSHLTACDYGFGIDTHAGAPTDCKYTITGTPATQANYNGQICGAFTISSGWSDQFGADKGFSTLAVTDQVNIAYPAYTDVQLVSGVTVTPDQSYAPQALP